MARHSTYDQDKVKELRMKLIDAGLAIIDGKAEVKKWSALKREYVLKVGSRVLPVLNAGKDDDSDLIPAPLLAGKSNGKHDGNKKVTEPEEED